MTTRARVRGARRLWPLLIAMGAAACGGATPTPERIRDPHPITGQFTVQPPVEGPHFTVTQVATRTRPATWTADMRQIPKTVDVEIRLTRAAELRAADFWLVPEPLAEIAPERPADLAPRPARGLATAPDGPLRDTLRVGAGEAVWLRFEPVELRTWTAADGVSVPLRLTVEHRAGESSQASVILDPARGRPVWAWTPSPWRLYSALEGVFGAPDGTRGFGTGLGVRYQGEAFTSTATAIVRWVGTPRPDAIDGALRAGTELGAQALVGYLLPIGEHSGLRLGVGWSAAWRQPSGGGDGALLHALPIELALVTGPPFLPSPVTSSERSVIGVYLRVAPGLGVLAGDADEEVGMTGTVGIETSSF